MPNVYLSLPRLNGASSLVWGISGNSDSRSTLHGIAIKGRWFFLELMGITPLYFSRSKVGLSCHLFARVLPFEALLVRGKRIHLTWAIVVCGWDHSIPTIGLLRTMLPVDP